MNQHIDVTGLGASDTGLQRQALTTALAIVPVSMLFGVLAGRADWSWLDAALIGLLGFTGSGQFAVLPLATSGAGFWTMLLLTACINLRYLPIAYMSKPRLPRAPIKRALLAHILGDEAYALERDWHGPAQLWRIRLTIFGAWVAAGALGAWLGRLVPESWMGNDLNLGYPASVVLLFLSVSQIRNRMFNGQEHVLSASVLVCTAALAWALLELLGPVYFWIPSVLLTTFVLKKAMP